MTAAHTLLCLDIGEVRIGVARANSIARIAEPVKTIANDEVVVHTLQEMIAAEPVAVIVVGLPQNRNHEDTDQTRYVRDVVARLEKEINIPFIFQDEAGSSQKAEEILRGRGKSYPKEAIDAEAATLILQDYIEEQL